MRVIVAPDKFKGTLTGAEAAEAIARGLRSAGADADVSPVADGGEGTLDALVAAAGGSIMGVIARGPLGTPVRAHLGRLDDGTGVVELSQASGLRLVAETDLDPLRASTYGTGELLKGALARRPTKVLIAIGGSATVDGGMGIARALGVRFLDAAGAELQPCGQNMERVARIDPERLDSRLVGIPITVAADVMSLLVGPEGAARMFGPQKGATPKVVELLERGLAVIGERIEQDLGIPVLDAPGGGAAGGAGAMLLGLGAELRSGAEVVLEAIGFERRLVGADLVVTGEGLLDAGTTAGKAPMMVARMAAAAGIPCIALVGDARVRPAEFADVRTLTEHFGTAAEARERAAAGLQSLAARLVLERKR
ncbi:MAG: glycerate kinase [Actinomycetota bacterium]